MSSGFSGGGDFYNTTGYGGFINGNNTGAVGIGIGGGSSGMMNNVQQFQQLQYRSSPQILQQDNFSSTSSSSSPPLIPFRRTDFVPKRSLVSEQQQQAFLRSVKQRSQYNHTSPISPLTPFDFSSINNNYNNSNHHHQGTVYNPFIQQQFRSLPINPNNNTSIITTTTTATTNNGMFNSNLNFSAPNREPERDSEKKMRNRLQELEKALLDDDDSDDLDVSAVVGGAGDSVSAVTSSEWSETMQNLLSPNQNQQNLLSPNQNQKPFSPSPTSSCSSSSSPSTTSSLICSPKQSLVDVATAISEGKLDTVTANLDRLKQISNPRGDPEQRLTSYMLTALKSKVNPVENPPPVTEISSSEQIIATQMLYEASPCFKLGFMAANLAILESLKEEPNNNVHVIDFEVGQGIQYITLIHALAERPSELPTFIKITSVADAGKEDEMKVVGDRLRKLADRRGVVLQFNVVNNNINSLNHESLHCEANESLVVNFAFKLYKMPDESVSLENPRDELLRLVKGLDPRVVTMVEHEMNCNTAPFVARVGEVSSYYLALFNSLDSTMTRDGAERVRIEECLGRKAANSVACEGRERVERCEVFGKWRARMGMAGFVSRPLGQHVAELMRTRLNSAYRNNPGFTVKEEAGGICFGWMGRVLTVASAWR